MKAIVDRLETYGEFEITYFGDDTILNKPIAEWPACDCLLSWHSDGFPLGKVVTTSSPERSFLSHSIIYAMPPVLAPGGLFTYMLLQHAAAYTKTSAPCFATEWISGCS